MRFKYKDYIGSVLVMNGRKNMGTITIENGLMTKTLYKEMVAALSNNNVLYIN